MVSFAARCSALPVAYARFHDIFTDASVKGGRAGIGINYHTRHELERYSLVRRPDRRPDSNHAELAAIFIAMLHSQEGCKNRIFTDSQASMDMIHGGTLDPRFSVLVRCSRWMLVERSNLLLFKVKGHSGVAGNEMAHCIAASGRRSKSIILPDLLMEDPVLRDHSIPGLIEECSRLNHWSIESHGSDFRLAFGLDQECARPGGRVALRRNRSTTRIRAS